MIVILKLNMFVSRNYCLFLKIRVSFLKKCVKIVICDFILVQFCLCSSLKIW
ncbi:MAG: hypothetical protein NBHMHEHC_00291 [Candidatus Westeberhardia cardiocondylae]|nr:hypothetical protein [Candidatus Westeberhardia cardiocondylae]